MIGDWSWLPEYWPKFVSGTWLTIQLLLICSTLGFLLAVPVGLVQVTGPKWLGAIARGFCTFIRGTPLLIQIWLIYYGVGQLFPQIDGIRETFIWPYLRAAFPYAVFALTVSVAGYVGEVMPSMVASKCTSSPMPTFSQVRDLVGGSGSFFSLLQ